MNKNTKTESMKIDEEKSLRLSGDGPLKIKRTNTYKIKDDEKSPIIDAMEQQEKELENNFYENEEDQKKILDQQSSSEDDEEFIRRSIINNQKRFSIINMDYFDQEKLMEIKEEPEIHHTIEIGSEEAPNGLAKL